MTTTTTRKNQRLTRREAAEYLGVAVRTLGIWASNGRYHLPYYKIGNRTLYELSDLDAFMEDRKMVHSGLPARSLL